jgi:hypothetical protein
MFHDMMHERTEVTLARRGAFKSEKRKKELARLKKQEEKRQRRFGDLPQKETEEQTAEGQEQTAEGQEKDAEGHASEKIVE